MSDSLRNLVCVTFSLALLACAAPVEELEVDETALGSCGGAGAPLGVDEGMGFAPMVLSRCDGSPFAFYGDDEGYCEARFTVLTIAAGWCSPCIRESAELETELVDRFGARGVRVAQVLIEDADYREASPEYCAGWTDRFELTRVPVLLDTTQSILPYYEGALPATIVIDDQGIVVHRELGASAGLETLRATLEVLLAE